MRVLQVSYLKYPRTTTSACYRKLRRLYAGCYRTLPSWKETL